MALSKIGSAGLDTLSGNLIVEGNVGVGTSSPDSNLHVLSTTLPQVKIDYNGTYYTTISNNGALNVVDPGTDNKWVFLRNGTEQMRIDSAGRVTIPYQPYWFGTNNNSYLTDYTTWITHPSGNNGGVNTGILKFPNAFSFSGTEWNGQRYTAQVSGLYHWEINLDIENGTGLVFRGVKNSARFHDEERIANIGSGWWNYNYSGFVYLSAGDYWEFQLTNGTWNNIAGGVWSKMGIRLVG